MGIAVVMTAYQRPDYLEQTLKSWAGVRGLADVVSQTIHVEQSSVEYRVKCLAWEYGWSPRPNGGRLGVLVNPVESVSWAFRSYPEADFVVIAEEDVVVASDILEYFQWAQRFRYDESVGVVCAHRPQGTTVAQPRTDAVLRVPGFSCPLLWGTWRDRWEDFIEPTWDRDYRADGWDWNLGRVLKMAGKCSLAPEQNRSDHIGEEGGAHCTPAMFPETVDPGFRTDLPVCEYQIVEGPALWSGSQYQTRWRSLSGCGRAFAGASGGTSGRTAGRALSRWPSSS